MKRNSPTPLINTTMLTRIRWAIPLGAIVLTSCVTNFPTHAVKICGTDYSVTGSIRKKHCKNPEYRLTVEGPGRPKRTMRLGDVPDDYSRATLLKELKDSLHKADLFLPCDGKSGENDHQLDSLIKLLIREPFPYSHDLIVATVTIDDNNVLKLMQQSASGQYQLVNEHDGGSTILVRYNDASHQYKVEWDLIKNDAFLLAHFDQWLTLYYRIAATAVKPELLIESNAGGDGLRGIIVRDFEGSEASQSGVRLSKAVAEKVSGSPETEVKIKGVNTKAKPVIDPNHPPKKTLHAPNLFERSN
jgi:hypothetical protein